jgi:hypothetical membrane protein
MKSFEVLSLRIALMVPFIYFAIIVLSSCFYPGYSHMRQTISELGANNAPHPGIFNVGVIINGAATLIGAFGYFRALKHLGASQLSTWLTASVLILFGIAILLVGLFPMPDPRHAGNKLPLVIVLGPLFLAVALWKQRKARVLNLYLIGTSVFMIITFGILFGVGRLVTHENVGLMQRISALAAFPWIGVSSYALSVWAFRPPAAS